MMGLMIVGLPLSMGMLHGWATRQGLYDQATKASNHTACLHLELPRRGWVAIDSRTRARTPKELYIYDRDGSRQLAGSEWIWGTFQQLWRSPDRGKQLQHQRWTDPL